MCDGIELQNMGRSFYQTPSRVNTTTVVLSLRMIITSIVILTVIIGAILSTSLYIIHIEKLKQVDAQISTHNLADLVNDLQHEYEEEMNQNISHGLLLDTKTLLQLHNSTKNQILKIYDETEKSFLKKGDKTVEIYRIRVIEKMDKSFAAISNEQTFRKVASEYRKLSNKTEEQIKELYDEEFQAAFINYTGRDPPEISAEFHEHVAELTISKALDLKIVGPYPTVFIQLEEILWAKYNKTLKDHTVIGIDFGESCIRSFVYANGHLKKCDKFNTYVGLEEFDGYSESGLKSAAITTSDEPLPIFYDLKEIIHAWNSFNTSSEDLFWTFNVQNGTNDGPRVSSSPARIQHSVESIVTKLFQRVKKANDVDRCVITVPYDSTKAQRDLILRASKTAGFQEVTLLDEAVSAALTSQYVFGPWNDTRKMMFLEFNQLSWRISLLRGHQSSFTIIYSDGYNETQDLVHICIKKYCMQENCTKGVFKNDGSIRAKIHWRLLYEECDAAILRFTESTTEKYYPIFQKWPIVYIDRSSTEKAIKEEVEDFTRFIDSVIGQWIHKIAKDKFDEVILGGKYGSLIVVKETISRYLNGRNLTINDVSPVDTIAYGAAVKGLELAAAAIKQSRVNETD